MKQRLKIFLKNVKNNTFKQNFYLFLKMVLNLFFLLILIAFLDNLDELTDFAYKLATIQSGNLLDRVVKFLFASFLWIVISIVIIFLSKDIYNFSFKPVLKEVVKYTFKKNNKK